ncbi:hypothetical protein YC2023_061034 [Brassica napus]
MSFAGPGPKPHVRPPQSLVPTGPRPKQPVRPLQSMVPAGSRSQSQIRPLEYLVPAGSGSQPQSRPLQSLSSPTSSSRDYNFDEFQKLEEPEEEFLEILQAYQTTTKRGIQRLRVLVKFDWGCSKGSLPKHREHCCSASCKRARENANTTSRSTGLHTLYSFGANGSKRSRRTHVPATIHPKGKAKPLGSGFQLTCSGSQLPGSGSRVPTTLLPLFLAMYPDIPLGKARPRGKHGQMS